MTDYATLLQDIQDWAEDEESEFVAEIPSMITRAEESLFRDAPAALEYNATATGTLTASDRTLTHGITPRSIRQLSITVSGATVYLDRRTDSFIDLYTPDPTTTGQPKFYAQPNNTTIVVAPTPDANYAYTLDYRAIPTGLSVSNTTTWFSTNQYDMLLDRCMVEAAKFKEDDEMLVRYKTSYAEKLEAFKQEILASYKNEDTSGA